jgi:hypothetical protein
VFFFDIIEIGFIDMPVRVNFREVIKLDAIRNTLGTLVSIRIICVLILFGIGEGWYGSFHCLYKFSCYTGIIT